MLILFWVQILMLNKIFFILSYSNLRINFYLFLSLFLAFSIAIFEAFFVGLFFFFISSLLDSQDFTKNSFVNSIINLFQITDVTNIKSYLTFLLIVNIILLTVIRFLHLKLNTYLYYKINSNVSSYLYKNLLNTSFYFHLKNNSSTLISAIVIKSKSVGEVLFFLLNILKSVLMLPTVIGFTIWLSSYIQIFFIFFIFLIVFYLGFSLIKFRVNKLGRIIAAEQDKIFKNLQESFLSINLVIVHKIAKFFYKIFYSSFLDLRKSEARIVFLNHVPYIILQSVIFIIGIVFLFFQTTIASFISIVPFLTMWFLAAQRILPNLNEIFSNYATIKSLEPSLNDIYKLMLQANLFFRFEINSKLEFNKFIEFKNVSYKHEDSKSVVFDQVNCLIKKNTFVGIFGNTGSGKSTAINLICGLIIPSSGTISIDNNNLDQQQISSWQNHVSLVPQSPILLDNSILLNIVLEIDKEKIDFSRLNLILKLVLLDEFISLLPNRINTIIGENGEKISGGQRQKIGIARALYRDTNILILDEATNSLDEATEEKLLNNIKKLNNKTIIMVSHNSKSKIYCEQVINVSKLKLIKEE